MPKKRTARQKAVTRTGIRAIKKVATKKEAQGARRVMKRAFKRAAAGKKLTERQRTVRGNLVGAIKETTTRKEAKGARKVLQRATRRKKR